jgi:hypothetical protein
MNTYIPNRVRRLNDEARSSLKGCKLVCSPAIKKSGRIDAIIRCVREYSSFNESSNLSDEHDFGCFEFEQQQIVWKIDCYDLDLTMRSIDPAEPSITCRVLTVMLAEEL